MLYLSPERCKDSSLSSLYFILKDYVDELDLLYDGQSLIISLGFWPTITVYTTHQIEAAEG